MENIWRKIRNKVGDLKTFRSMIANMFIKGISLILSYLYIPLLLNYLGDEKYGLWATVLSVVTWINLCDIGVGGGLRNILTRELTQGEKKKAQESISTAYVILSLMSLAIWGVLVFITTQIGWERILNTTIDIDMAMIISFSFVCINFVLALVNVVLYALQVSEQVGLVNLLSGIINIVGLIIIQHNSKGNIAYVAIVYGLSTFIPLVINNIRIFNKYEYLKPSIKKFEKSKTNELLTLGIVFFVLQLGGIVLSATDNIIISRMFGAMEVTPVEIINKLLSIVKGFHAALVIPVWARTAKAKTENDTIWMDKMYKTLMFILLLFGIGLLLLISCVQPICRIWLRKEISFDSITVIIISLGVFMEMINTSFYNMLNGLGKIKIQMYIAIIQIVVNVPLSLFLADSMKMGVNGVKLATTILFAFSGIIYMFVTKNAIKTINDR